MRLKILTQSDLMKQFTLEDLPKMVGKLYKKLDKIEKLLKDKSELKANGDEELLTISDASKLLNLSVATIYTKVCKHEIPVNKQGKRLYFYKTELLDWIKSGRIKTITEMQQQVELNINSNIKNKDR